MSFADIADLRDHFQALNLGDQSGCPAPFRDIDHLFPVRSIVLFQTGQVKKVLVIDADDIGFFIYTVQRNSAFSGHSDRLSVKLQELGFIT